jgi:iron complex outermembrane receptor protein
MRKLLFFLPWMVLSSALYAQITGGVTGIVKDMQSGEGLAGATVSVKGLQTSTLTDSEGKFLLKGLKPGKVVLLVSYVGYGEHALSMNIKEGETARVAASLGVSARPGDEVVISASKRPEKITNAPASIQVIGINDMEQFAGSNVGELVSKVQGVEYTRNGLTDITFNARGFHSAFNNKVFQIVDGRNSMAALSGSLPIMNRGSTIKDDMERLEIILGPQSALYGPNAHNAVFNTITKDPRKYAGTTISLTTGSRYQFSGRFRHAAKVSNKFAYKLSGEYLVGKEFDFRDSVYAGNQSGSTPYFGKPVAIPERLDPDFRHMRGEGHFYYTIKSKTDLILSGGSNNSNWPQVTTTGRNQMRGVTYSFLQARLAHPRYFVNVYNTWGSIGTSYVVANYTRDFWNRTHSTLPPGPPNGFLYPDEAEKITKTLFKEESQRTNADAQYNYKFENAGLFLVAGLNFQQDRPNGFGINLVDSFRNIQVEQYGAVIQLEKSLPYRIRLISATRVDHHSNFGTFFSPKFGIVKAVADGNFRVTWARAFSMPSILNQYSGIGGSLFGNGAGITYIPTGAKFSDPASLRTTDPLKPEQVSTWEVGYKGTITKKLFLDVNYYKGISKNFISPPRSVLGRALYVGDIAVNHNSNTAGTVQNDILIGGRFSTFFNYGEVKVSGIDAGLTYTFNKFVSLAVKYSWFTSGIMDDDMRNDANKDSFVSKEETSLNAPQHRGAVILGFQNLLEGKVYLNLSARILEEYDFYSGSQIGTAAGKGERGLVYGGLGPNGQPRYYPKNFDWGPLGGFTTVDLSAGYKFNQMISAGVSITNLFNTEQIEFVGSPSISRLISFELRVHVPQAVKKK